jgi:tetratricopeptide (TPR) repeat protein
VLYLLRGDLARAEQKLSEAIQAVDERFLLAVYRAHWGLAIGLAGRYDESIAAFEDAHHVLTAHRNPNQAFGVLVLRDALEAACAHQELAERKPKAIERLRAPLRTAERLRAAPGGRDAAWSGVRTAAILLDQQLAGGPLVAPPAVDAATTQVLWVGPETAWFAVQDAVPTDLERRSSLRRLMAALVEQRFTQPGVGMTLDELSREGWPGERMLQDAAKARIRVAMSTLRREGLRDALLTKGAAYLLDPAVSVVMER